MEAFHRLNGALLAEDLLLDEIAERFGTPCYVYSRAAIEARYRAFDTAFGAHPHLVCYAVKANSNLAVLGVLARMGAGFDIVSGGELERVLRAGGDPRKVVFSGVGKAEGEMRRALELGIRCFNVESASELERLNDVAGTLGLRAPVSLRVNPDVDAGTHPYIATGLLENKFGVDIASALSLYLRAVQLTHIEVTGIDCHIGSQIMGLAPFRDALARVLDLVARLREAGIGLKHLDLGGGLGIRYRDEIPPSPGDYVRNLLEGLGNTDCEILIEPGRSIVGPAGVLLTRVEYLKRTPQRNFAIVDAAMNDLIRPSLYGAWMDIVPVRPRDGDAESWDVVGPVCETGDFLGKERSLVLHEDDLLAVTCAGAYGAAMASNYNTRPRPAEVMADCGNAHLVTRRETLDEMLAREYLIPE